MISPKKEYAFHIKDILFYLLSLISDLYLLNKSCSQMINLSRFDITMGAGTILYVGGPTNQNKLYGKSGGGDQYIGGPPKLLSGGGISTQPPCCSAPIYKDFNTSTYIQCVGALKINYIAYVRYSGVANMDHSF